MQTIARPFLVVFLATSLLNLPAMAAGGKPVGMVVTAENAHLGEANAAMGTNIFGGDSLQTDPGGTLRVKVGGNQLYLASASSATLLDEQSKIRVKLTQGTIGFSSPIPSQFEIETPVGTVRAANGKAAFGEVTIVGPQKILVAAYRGSILVSGGGVERIVKEGDAYNVTFLPNADPSALAQGPQGAGASNGTDKDNGNDNGNNQNDSGNNQKGGGYAVQNHGPIIFTAVVLGIAAGGAFAAWHVATESDSTPH